MLRIRQRLGAFARPLLATALSLWGERLPHPLLVTSIPKSGSHLCISLLRNLRQVHLEPVTLLPYRKLESYRGALASHNRASYVWGHVGYNDTVRDLMQAFPDYRVLVVLRDPRDVVCSLIDHVCSLNPHVLKSYLGALEPPGKRIDAVIAGVPHDSYPRDPELARQGVYDMYPGFAAIETVCRSYLEWKNHSRAAFIHFEDMLETEDRGTRKAGASFGIDELMEFLGIETTAAERRDLIHKAFDRNSPTFNVGRINRHREIFSRGQAEAFIRDHAALLDEMGYRAK